LPSKFAYAKFQDGGNQLFGGNSAICEQIRTKFDTETETQVLDQVLPAKLN